MGFDLDDNWTFSIEFEPISDNGSPFMRFVFYTRPAAPLVELFRHRTDPEERLESTFLPAPEFDKHYAYFSARFLDSGVTGIKNSGVVKDRELSNLFSEILIDTIISTIVDYSWDKSPVIVDPPEKFEIKHDGSSVDFCFGYKSDSPERANSKLEELGDYLKDPRYIAHVQQVFDERVITSKTGGIPPDAQILYFRNRTVARGETFGTEL